MEVEYNFTKFTIKNLKYICTSLHIDATGNKNTLIERLNYQQATNYKALDQCITMMELTKSFDDIHMDVEQ